MSIASTDRIEKLKEQLDQTKLVLQQIQSQVGPQHPRAIEMQKQAERLQLQLSNEELASKRIRRLLDRQRHNPQPAASITSAASSRSGVYSFDGHEINLLYALITAGFTPDLQDKSVSITCRFPDGDKVVFTSRRVGDMMEGKAARPILQPNDVVMVEVPRDNAAVHFVRLVVGPDRMTLEGKPVNWDNLTDELKNLPDTRTPRWSWRWPHGI